MRRLFLILLLFFLPLTAWAATYQSGSMLYLDNGTIRVGLEKKWGAVLAEFRINGGPNIINRPDNGRGLQFSFYSGNARYDGCSGCTGVWGWNPVQGGDKYGHGSPVLEAFLGDDFIYTKTRALEWNLNRAASNLYVEQWFSLAPGRPEVVKLKYRITYVGAATHGIAAQEMPCLFTGQTYRYFARYQGTAPWTDAPVTFAALPAANWKYYTPEKWFSLTDGKGVGITLFYPNHLPNTHGRNFGGVYSYMASYAFETFFPGAVLEGEMYLIGGHHVRARQIIYEMKNTGVVNP